MDIHPPEGPTRSFKDFAIHILIVTIGILIALSLEGLRESVHEHHAVAEARKTFDRELRFNQDHLKLDLPRVSEMQAQVEQVLADMPQLAKEPAQLQQRVAAVQPAFYFFVDTGWNAALASGALASMKNDELERFEGAYVDLRNYQDSQKLALPQWIAVSSYFASRRSYNAQEAAEGEERLRAFAMGLHGMEHVGKEFQGQLKAALAEQ